MSTNCTFKRPEYEGELVVFVSPHNSSVLLVDEARVNKKYGHLEWWAVDHESPEYKEALSRYFRKN